MSMTMAEAHRQISQIREYLHEIGHDGRMEIIAAVEVAMRTMESEMGIMQDMLEGQQITQEEIWRVTEGLRHCSVVGEFCDDCPAHMLCGNGKEQATFLREVLRVLEKLTKILEREAADRVCVRSSNGDLISRSALLTVPNVCKVTEYDETGCGISYNAVSVAAIEAAPAVDAELVRHGRWLPTSDENKKRCSECDVIHLIAQYPHGRANYCPNCGAKMDEKVNFTAPDDDMLGYRDTV